MSHSASKSPTPRMTSRAMTRGFISLDLRREDGWSGPPDDDGNTCCHMGICRGPFGIPTDGLPAPARRREAYRKRDGRKPSINLLVGPHRLPTLLQDLLRLVVAQDVVFHRLVIVRLQLRVLLHRLSRPLDQGGAGLPEGVLLVQRPTPEGDQGHERDDRPKDER